MRLVNLTAHKIDLLFPNGKQLVCPSSGIVARCGEEIEDLNETVKIGYFDLPLCRKKFGEVMNLPGPQKDILFFTSHKVAEVARRPDVLSCGRIVLHGNFMKVTSLAKFGPKRL